MVKDGLHDKLGINGGGQITLYINNLNFQIMSKKTFQLISGIVGGVQAIAVAVVTYTSPEYATAINGAIVVVGTAVIEACSQFVKAE